MRDLSSLLDRLEGRTGEEAGPSRAGLLAMCRLIAVRGGNGPVSRAISLSYH